MKPYKPLIMLGMLSLTALPLTACQTPYQPSSSVIIAETATDIEYEVSLRYCEALKPQPVPPDDYNASPVTIRNAMAGNVAAWVQVCLQ
jgi:hypothetical protein